MLTFIEDKTYRIFTIEGWDYIATNGGSLQKIIEDMGYLYKDCYSKGSW